MKKKNMKNMKKMLHQRSVKKNEKIKKPFCAVKSRQHWEGYGTFLPHDVGCGMVLQYTRVHVYVLEYTVYMCTYTCTGIFWYCIAIQYYCNNIIYNNITARVPTMAIQYIAIYGIVACYPVHGVLEYQYTVLQYGHCNTTR